MSKAYFFQNTTPVDHTLASDKREAWMPKTGDGYFDKSARQYFTTKTQKRHWLRRAGMREAGELYNAKRAPPGAEGNTRKHPRQQTCWKTQASLVSPRDV